MIKTGFKKNKKGPARTCFRGACPTKSFKGGFALLFSVLVSSLLLTIGLSIFNIALKELAISTASRQSIYAFYAADSGREYARYRDLKFGDFPDISSLLSTSGISTSSSLSSFVVNGDNEGSNFIVTVSKFRSSASSTVDHINTTVTSYGYDISGVDKVERAIRQDY
jgi:hypothetical protein